MAAETGTVVDEFLGKELEFDGRRVTLQRVIAEGGYAAVYAATDSGGQKFVVKKVLAGAPEVKRQTALEVKVHSSLSHPNIVKLLGWRAFQMPGGTQAFLSLLEWCPHGDLLARLDSATGPISTASVAKVMAAVAAGIAHLHASTTPSAAHRDIKPENVLVGEGGVLKLCDFGSLNQHSGPVTKADRVEVEDDILRFCTPQYRSPELVDLYTGHPVDHRSDMWAMGCLQYALMFQEHPFDITSSLAILSGKYKVPPGHAYPPSLLHALDCCLAMDPTHRPSAQSLADFYSAVAQGSSPPPPPPE